MQSHERPFLSRMPATLQPVLRSAMHWRAGNMRRTGGLVSAPLIVHPSGSGTPAIAATRGRRGIHTPVGGTNWVGVAAHQNESLNAMTMIAAYTKGDLGHHGGSRWIDSFALPAGSVNYYQSARLYYNADEGLVAAVASFGLAGAGVPYRYYGGGGAHANDNDFAMLAFTWELNTRGNVYMLHRDGTVRYGGALTDGNTVANPLTWDKGLYMGLTGAYRDGNQGGTATPQIFAGVWRRALPLATIRALARSIGSLPVGWESSARHAVATYTAAPAPAIFRPVADIGNTGWSVVP